MSKLSTYADRTTIGDNTKFTVLEGLTPANRNVPSSALKNWIALGFQPITATKAPIASSQVNAIPETVTFNLGGTNTNNALLVGRQTQVNVTSTGGALTGAGHVIGNEITLHVEATGTVTHALMIGHEVAVEHIGTGQTTTLLYGYVAHPINVQGTVGMYSAYHAHLAEGDINALATMVVMADFHSPDVSALTKLPLLRYSLYNEDPDKLIGTAGQVMLASGQEAAPAAHAGVKPARYYCGVLPFTLSAAPVTANLVYYLPTHIPHRVLVTRIGCHVDVAGDPGTEIQLAIYKAKEGMPDGSPIASSGVLDGETTGDKEATVSVTLEAGLYFFALTSNGTPTVKWLADLAMAGANGGTTSTGLETTAVFAGTYGTWAVAPSITWVNASNSAPLVYWRHLV